MTKKLTKENLDFCEEYVKNGYKARQAYLASHPECKSEMAASVSACKLLKDKRIQDEIDRVEGSYKTLAFDEGIDKKTILRILQKMMHATKKIVQKNGETLEQPDYTAQNNAILTYARLTGELTDKKKIEIDDKQQIKDLDLENKSDEELREMEKELLKNI